MIATEQETPKCYSYIRFSTPDQLKGDSLRRQLELSEKYAKEKGLILDDSLKMRDLGLSAFKGEHRTRGALGRFQTLVEAGSIPKGSTLIVESLDRLSREGVFDALTYFMNIIREGIKVVTLTDSMEYTRESINANLGMQLILSIVSLGRGHEESSMKSERLGAAWKTKRKNIAEKKLTSKCPQWLQLSKDKTSFIKIPERCKMIKRIFNLSRSSVGAESIAKTLNKEGGDWLPKNGWHKSYILKILKNRAALGEFQPHAGRGKERRPIGEPIKDYYPAIITEELFYSVQRTGRRFGGRNGKISNLVGGLAKCGYCGGPMRFIDKGKPPKGGSYLVCDNAVRGRGCERHSWPYPEIEKLVMIYCKGLDVTDLLTQASSKPSELATLNGELAVVNGKSSKLAEKTRNLVEQIEDTPNKAVRQALDKRLSEILEEQSALAEEKARLQRDILKLSSAQQDATEQIASLKELMQFMEKERGEKLVQVRERLRNRLRSLIDKIAVYPVGTRLPWMKTPHLSKDRRALEVNLKSGSNRVIRPGMSELDMYEKEEGRTYYFGADGKVDVNVDGEEFVITGKPFKQERLNSNYL